VGGYSRGGIKCTTTAAGIETLLSEVLPFVAERAGQEVRTTIIRCTGIPDRNAVMERWRVLGGLVPPHRLIKEIKR
jgi:hypothetical protein